MKEAPLRRVLDRVKPGVAITVVTRWFPVEVASGVSDLGCRELVNAHQNSDFRLLSPLHAKYYRFDDIAYVGSANLTMRGLGWTSPSNIELLIDTEPIERFELEIVRQSVLATDEMQKIMETAVAHIPRSPAAESFETVPETSCSPTDLRHHWIPRCRIPDSIFDIQRNADEYSLLQALVAREDLRRLAVPPCEDEAQFNAIVAASLIMQPAIVSLIEFAKLPRRFGEVREWVRSNISSDEDATLRTQVVYRWVQHFLPGIFEIDRPRHSEIIRTRR
ncbi:hypothetical protein [Rhodococcus aetherivorans]|uniref:hypothetical protein n=1 Tax=Rhodococcus aetherivorans TaxID=191292 RepID=UPI001E5A5037|nr:hypothetical protein [Rhodococcus aetherivorans]UGQ39593.1 hypothetical protein LRQ66_15460 [Rhodococcus aetherivorans]